jgi:hypothetical protein
VATYVSNGDPKECQNPEKSQGFGTDCQSTASADNLEAAGIESAVSSGFPTAKPDGLDRLNGDVRRSFEPNSYSNRDFQRLHSFVCFWPGRVTYHADEHQRDEHPSNNDDPVIGTSQINALNMGMTGHRAFAMCICD